MLLFDLASLFLLIKTNLTGQPEYEVQLLMKQVLYLLCSESNSIFLFRVIGEDKKLRFPELQKSPVFRQFRPNRLSNGSFHRLTFLWQQLGLLSCFWTLSRLSAKLSAHRK
jgi:hypothetical protein